MIFKECASLSFQALFPVAEDRRGPSMGIKGNRREGKVENKGKRNRKCGRKGGGENGRRKESREGKGGRGKGMEGETILIKFYMVMTCILKCHTGPSFRFCPFLVLC